MPRSTRCLSSIFLITLFALIVPSLVSAYPLYGDLWELKQPDGSMVTVKIWGDEYYQVVESLDGYTLIRDPRNDVICYARLSTDGNELVSTGVRVGSADPIALGIAQHVRINQDAAITQAKRMRDLAGVDMPGVMRPDALPPPSTGNVTGIVLLVDFSDQTATIPAGDVDDFCNQPGYSDNGNNGSVKDYFSDISDGALSYDSWVMDHYYRPGATFSGYYDDCSEPWLDRAKELIVEVLDSLDTEGVDFTQFDSNGDNYIDAINLFYAGSTACGWALGMWPGSGGMKDMWTSSSGIKTDRFQITGMGGSLTLGTYCHENGHMVGGWPDLYDYSPPGPNDSAGAGRWCLMASQYSLNPQEPCAYLKMTAGWLTPTVLNSDAFGVNIGPSSNNNNVYRINSPVPTEFYMLENRRQSARDANLPDSGLEILHIETVNGSNTNQEMTTALHYLVTIIQADGNWDLENNVNRGDSGDLYSAPSATAFTPCTSPAADWWDFTSSGYYITNISNSADIMTFDFTIGDQDPVAQTKDYGADADTDCCIDVSVSDIDDGSYDPNGEGDIASLLITRVDGSPVTPAETVEVCGDGMHTVTLTITDLCGTTDESTANVEVENEAPVAVCKSYSADADTNCCIVVHKNDIDGGTYDPDGPGDIKSFGISAVDGNAITLADSVEVCGNGMHTVTLTVTDWCDSTSSCDAPVEVIDVTPPEIVTELNRDCLWPPNHKMVDILVDIEVTDNCDPDPYWELYEITSDEPDNGKGDGNTEDDIQGDDWYTEDTAFQLRSERSGKLDGRTYTIIYRAEDESGNVAFDTSSVIVPHDMGHGVVCAMGFNSFGTGFLAEARTFTLVIPSTGAVYGEKGNREYLEKPAVNATEIDVTRAYVGNSAGVLRPIKSTVVDYNQDGLDDLALTYLAKDAKAIPTGHWLTAADGLGKEAEPGYLGLHFMGQDGTPYLATDIFALGEPVDIRGVDDEPEIGKDERPIDVTSEETVKYDNGIASIHPNPFNPSTTVRFTLASAGDVTLAIYDVRGALVRVLVDRNLPGGEHNVGWDGTDSQGRTVATGVYFARMVTGQFEMTRKMVLVK